MGVEYRHYLVPRPSNFMPAAEQLAGFINALAAERWILTPDSAEFGKRTNVNVPRESAATGATISHRQRERKPAPFPLTVAALEPLIDRHTRLLWHFFDPTTCRLQHPLTPIDRLPFDETYYDIGFEWSPSLVYRQSECIDPFDKTTCSCGTELAFEDETAPFYSSFIQARCPKCARSTDVSTWRALYHDGLTGEETTVSGGATSRFVLIVDCGKGFPADGPMALKPGLVAAFRNALRCDCYEIGDFY